MNITGIVVEYNPFHNGHLFHATQAKQLTNADVVVAVMSGNFLQRGEPALVSKWARTQMALACGVDIVVELPYVYATQHAELFAQGSVSILKNIGANFICFGSEAGKISEFQNLVVFLKENELSYNALVGQLVKQGLSYPKALAEAFSKLANKDDLLDLTKPNNILGYHYVKAISDQQAAIKPFTLLRENAQYHDKQISSQHIASATSIREALVKQKKDLLSIQHVVPANTYELLKDYKETYQHFQDWERLFPFLKYRVMTSRSKDLAQIYEAEEGLENRFMQTINEAFSFQSLMEKLKTKRYTWTRLQRLCLHMLTGTTKAELKDISTDCPYIRILGMTRTGRNYLNYVKANLNVPLITTISKHNHLFLEIEKRATASYSFGYDPMVQKKLLKEEYSHPPIIIT